MLSQFKNLHQLLDFFKEKEVCVKYLENMRWGNNPVCPHCSCEKTYRTNVGFKCASNKCYKKFSVLTGSIFENTKIPLRLWFATIYLATAHKKGISSLQLSKDIGVTQKTAWFMMHRIREMFKEEDPEMLEGTIEMDETYVKTGKKEEVPVHPRALKRGKQGRSMKDKTPVFGMIQRDGKVIAMQVKDVRLNTLKPIIERMVKKGSLIITDELGSYKHLDQNFVHEVINHSKKEYARGEYTTNTIEGFWSVFKRGYYGTYHYMSEKHLQRYCDEFAYRYNIREKKDAERFNIALKRCDGVRLKYDQLIA